jgi:hypothetical protein
MEQAHLSARLPTPRGPRLPLKSQAFGMPGAGVGIASCLRLRSLSLTGALARRLLLETAGLMVSSWACGLWSSWKGLEGDLVHSFTLLTVNAEDHPLMRQFHKPGDEKRMVVVLPEERYDAGCLEIQALFRLIPR